MLYLPPSGDTNTDLEVISSYDDVPQILHKQENTTVINMYVMPLFSKEECSKDPFLMKLRNRIVTKTRKELCTKEKDLVIEKTSY